MRKFIFTTSWDDGSVLDLRVAEILDRHGMKGTFYIPKQFDGEGGKYSKYERRLSEDEIRFISSNHEVGGHSLSHRRLTDLTSEEADTEIRGSQEFLSKIISKNIDMFAFPGGKYNSDLISKSVDSGFRGGRIAEKLAITKPEGFIMNTTMVCNPFPFRKLDSDHYYWLKMLSPLQTYKPMQFAWSWGHLARKLFRKAYREGNYFHLSGHSWELENYGMWEELESFLGFVKKHSGICYHTNGEIMNQQ